MRYGKFLEKGDTIGFVAPSFGCTMEPYRSAFASATEKLEGKGYRTAFGPNCYVAEGVGISNTPEKCAAELQDWYCGSQSDVLISCGGGELMCEILPHLDFDAIRKVAPKLFMGYSDNTNFTFLLSTLCDTAAVYGPCAGSFGMEPWHESISDALSLLTGEGLTAHGYDLFELTSEKDEEHPLTPYHLTEKRVLFGEDSEFSGRLLGGCLDVLSCLVGTPFDQVKEFNRRYADDGVIWFFEACDLNVFSIRRALWQLREAAWFANAKGFLIGRPMHFDEPMMNLDRHRAVTDILGDIGVPIIQDLDIGHLPPMMPLLTGSLGHVVVRGNDISIRMETV